MNKMDITVHVDAMGIITITVDKGGPGKTTFAHNFAEWLRKKYRILLIDLDDSANLTNRYGEFDKYENTVVSLFETGNVEPIHIGENLDLIAGHKAISDLKIKLMSRRSRETILSKWLAKNREMLESRYDYIIIDTENDDAVLTENAIIVADLVLGIAEPGKDSVKALPNLRGFVDAINEDFDEDTQFAFIANKINLSEGPSKELLKSLVGSPEYLGYLPRRVTLADEEAIFNQKLGSKHKPDLEHINKLFDRILDRVKEVA